MPERRQRIMEAWNSYMAGVYPGATAQLMPEQQRDDLQMAFFAGAVHAWGLCVGGPPHWDTEEEGMAVINDLELEFQAYLERRKAIVGRAL